MIKKDITFENFNGDEVTVNYKGWHSVADVHERENGAWD